MKLILFALSVLTAVLFTPAYADCGGSGYEPFIAAVSETNDNEEVVFAFED